MKLKGYPTMEFSEKLDYHSNYDDIAKESPHPEILKAKNLLKVNTNVVKIL